MEPRNSKGWKSRRRTTETKENIQREISPVSLGRTVGTASGGATHTTVAGGWSGTDDETSDAPSDGGETRLVEDDDRVPERIIDTAYEQFERREEEDLESRLEKEDLDEMEERFQEQAQKAPGRRQGA